MTEDEWLACSDTRAMLTFLQERGASYRKLRLAVAAAYRRALEVYVEAHWRDIIGLVERWADGKAQTAEVDQAAKLYHSLCMYSQCDTEISLASAVIHMTGMGEAFRPGDAVDCCCTAYGGALAGYGSAWNPPLREQFEREIEAEARAAARDVFGNPFRPAPFESAWHTDTAVALARQMYASRDFSAMPILADALQDADCDNEDFLNHCRDINQVHVRGCWVLDAVLGKA